MTKNTPRGRPKRVTEVTEVKIRAEPELIEYLDLLVGLRRGYGKSRPQVAEYACWRLIEDLQSKNIIKNK